MAATKMVNFPIDDDRFKHTGEDGMYIRLVVEDPKVAYDKREFVIMCDDYTNTDFHHGAVAVLNMDDTNICLYQKEEEYYWRAAYKDLTPQGKDLFDAVSRAYKGYRIYLQTFLQT